MLVGDFKKGINKSLKEVQENTAKKVEDHKEETQKSLKELQENNQCVISFNSIYLFIYLLLLTFCMCV
jgi:hypothetical protein